MITIGYGMHRTPDEILVAEMMEELSKEPYENLKFTDLNGKDWAYLNEHSDEFAFDIHGGVSKTEVKLPEKYVTLPPYPSVSFLLFSNVTEEKFLPTLRRYLSFRGYGYRDDSNAIFLSHKNEILINERIISPKVPFKDWVKATQEADVEKKLVGVELVNAKERWQIVTYHKPFMEKLLHDLNSLHI